MELILLIIGALLVLFGFIGSFLPVVPGLPISLLGILIMQWIIAPFSSAFIWGWTLAIVLFFILDNFIPAWTSQKTGGTSYGFWGSLFGMIFGIGLPPIGFIIGPLVGAFLGEIISGQGQQRALRAAWGSFLGFMAATGIKVIAALILCWHYGTKLIQWVISQF